MDHVLELVQVDVVMDVAMDVDHVLVDVVLVALEHAELLVLDVVMDVNHVQALV